MAASDIEPATGDSGDWPSEGLTEEDASVAGDPSAEAVPETQADDEPDRLRDVLQGGPLEAYRANGSILGAYEIESEIARGGMGRIYRARHRELGRRVALKVLLAGVEATQRERDRFLREATLGANLQHPGIVCVHDYGVEDGLAYLAMEFVEGTTLHAVLPDIEPDALAALLADVGDALGHAHANGVVHRDLKPANIMLRDSDGSPAVTDFGLARDLSVASALTRAGATVGTPAYMAPEQTRGETPTPATDVFALGVLLYEGLTRELPFDGSSVNKLYTQINTADPPRPSTVRAGVPAALSAVCMRALEKHPEDRFPDGAAFAAALRAALTGEAPARRRGIPAATAVVLLGVIVAIALALGTGPGGPSEDPSAPSSKPPAPQGPALPVWVDPLPRTARFTADEPISGEGWILIHGLSTLQLEVRQQELAKRGFQLDELSVNGWGHSPRFAGVWRRDDGVERASRIGVSRHDYHVEEKKRQRDGWHLHRSVRWGQGRGLRFAGLWRRRGWSPVRSHDGHDLDADGVARWLTRMSRRGRRPIHLEAQGEARAERFAGVAVEDGRRALSFHSLRPDAYQVVAGVLAGSGYEPAWVMEYGSKRTRRVSCSWVRERSPALWRTTGPSVPELVAFDDPMRAAMKVREVSAAQLAVIREGRLVLARGYTLAPASQQPTQPTSLFRIGSLSQPLTAVGVLRLVDSGTLRLDDSLGSMFPELTSSTGPSWDPRLAKVTVRQLLQHRGGWDRQLTRGRFDPKLGYAVFDPAYLDERYIAAGLGVDPPINARQIMDYMNAQPLEFTPGSRSEWSSYGYLVLGRVIEAKTGRSYAGYMTKDTLAAMGPNDLHVGDGRLSKRARGEALHESNLLEPSAFGDGSVVPVHYGGWTLDAMDAHGGWVGSAVDLARFLSRLAFPALSPLLSPKSIEAMWTPHPEVPFGLAWDIGPHGRVSADGGRLPGCWGHMELSGADGFVVLFNRQAPAPELVEELRTLMDKTQAWPDWDMFPR